MHFLCNVTMIEGQTQINSTVFYMVKMVTMSVSCTLNTILSVPLLLVIVRSPSLLQHTRFFLLTHLLLCNNLQVGPHFGQIFMRLFQYMMMICPLTLELNNDHCYHFSSSPGQSKQVS